MTTKSPSELAAEQAAYWNGPGGEGWLAAYMRIQRALGDIGDRALAAAAARPGEHVIDIGCGTGDTTAALAKAVAPGGHVLGVDISETLVGAARSHRLHNATFVVGDAATHPFKAASYDLVFSRFGVMFFGDPVAAFRNIRSALKPAGRLAFVAWRTPQENPWGTVPLRAAQPFLPPQPRPVLGVTRPGKDLPPGISDTRDWSDEELWNALEKIKNDQLDWKNAAGSARKWWETFQDENKHRPALIYRLAEELRNRKATITEFFLAYVYSNTDNIQANLHYLDYKRLKESDEGTKPG